MPNILGKGTCKCLTDAERYWISESLLASIISMEKDIEKKQGKIPRDTIETMKESKKQLYNIRTTVLSTPYCG